MKAQIDIHPDTEIKMSENKELITFDVNCVSKISGGLSDDDILKLSENCKALVIESPEDKKGYDAVYEAHQITKNHISAFNKNHKKYKSVVTYVGGLLDGEKNRLLKLMEPIRDELKIKRDAIDKEKERIAAEKQKIKMENHQKQIDEIIEAGAVFERVDNGFRYTFGEGSIDDSGIWNLDAENYKFLLERIKVWKKEKDLREAEEARKRKEEEDRIEAERKAEEEKQAKIAAENRKRQEELDKKQAEIEERERKQKEEQEKIDREKRETQEKKEAEEREKQRQIELEEAKKKAAEEAKKQVEIDAKRKEEERIEKERLEKERLAEEERQKPDRQKLSKFLSDLSRLEFPEVKTKKAINFKMALKREIELLVEKYQERLS